MKQLFYFFAVLLLHSCNSTSQEPAIRVAVSSNMRYALDEINNRFEQIYGTEVRTVTASSGKLMEHILADGAYDIFFSSSLSYTDTLLFRGFVEAGPRFIAKGHLVAWSVKDIDLSDSLAVLETNSVRKAALTKPKYSPHGSGAQAACVKLEMPDSIFDKFIYSETAEGVVSLVKNGYAEVGFISKAVVLSPLLAGQGHWVEVDTLLYNPLEHSVVKLRHNNNRLRQQVDLYYEFLFGVEAQMILQKYGYQTRDFKLKSFF